MVHERKLMVVGAVRGPALLAVLAKPAECPGCGHMAALVVNRAGRTRCCDCDARQLGLPRAGEAQP